MLQSAFLQEWKSLESVETAQVLKGVTGDNVDEKAQRLRASNIFQVLPRNLARPPAAVPSRSCLSPCAGCPPPQRARLRGAVLHLALRQRRTRSLHACVRTGQRLQVLRALLCSRPCRTRHARPGNDSCLIVVLARTLCRLLRMIPQYMFRHSSCLLPAPNLAAVELCAAFCILFYCAFPHQSPTHSTIHPM